MRLNHSTTFAGDFKDEKASNGQLTVTDGVLKATGTTTNDRAFKAYYSIIQGYSRVRVTVMVRAQVGRASLGIDAGTTSSSLVNLALIHTTSKGWTPLELDIIVPRNYTYIRIAFGRTAGETTPSEIYYKEPKIEIENELTGSPVVIAQGMIGFVNGTISIRPATKSFGIGTVQYEANNKLFKVYLNNILPNGDYGGYPIIQVTGTYDNPLIPLVGGYSGDKFHVRFSNGTDFVDVANMTLYFYITVSF